MHFNDRNEIIELTPLWKGERFPDGRPKVPDEYLDALQKMTLEEVWKPIYVLGYENQFVGGGEAPLHTLHDDGRKLIGRAVTCSYCPTRPDLHEIMFAKGAEEGRKGNYNQWVIDTLVERDVVVVDMYDKIYKGTFLGGNLTTAIRTRTKTGGAVVWGGIRDVEQMKQVPDVQVYYRGIDPTPIREFVMTGFNSVTNFGGAVCLPGDVVFGAGGNNSKATTTIAQFDPRELEENRPEDLRGLYNVDMQAFENVIRLNTMGSVYPILAFAKYMVKAGSGSIVNFASMNSYCPLTRNFAYAMSKAAVVNFTESLAAYFAEAGIRINAVAPGFIVNERSKVYLGTVEDGLTERGKKVIGHTPMGKFGQAGDMFGCVKFLLDERASSFVTGVTIPVDGGFLTLSGV